MEELSSGEDATICFEELLEGCNSEEVSTMMIYIREVIDAKVTSRDAKVELVIKNGKIRGYNLSSKFTPISD